MSNNINKTRDKIIKISTIVAIVVSATILGLALLSAFLPSASISLFLLCAELLPFMATGMGMLCGLIITSAPAIIAVSSLLLVGAVLLNLFLPKFLDSNNHRSAPPPPPGPQDLPDYSQTSRAAQEQHIHVGAAVQHGQPLQRTAAPFTAPAQAVQATPAVVVIEHRSSPTATQQAQMQAASERRAREQAQMQAANDRIARQQAEQQSAAARSEARHNTNDQFSNSIFGSGFATGLGRSFNHNPARTGAISSFFDVNLNLGAGHTNSFMSQGIELGQQATTVAPRPPASQFPSRSVPVPSHVTPPGSGVSSHIVPPGIGGTQIAQSHMGLGQAARHVTPPGRGETIVAPRPPLTPPGRGNGTAVNNPVTTQRPAAPPTPPVPTTRRTVTQDFSAGLSSVSSPAGPDRERLLADAQAKVSVAGNSGAGKSFMQGLRRTLG